MNHSTFKSIQSKQQKRGRKLEFKISFAEQKKDLKMKNLTTSAYLETESNYLNLTRKTRGVRKRHRTHFTPQQVEKLEEIFTQQTSSPYRELILQLSTTLNLTDKNISIWFKNRRAKERKQQNETGSTETQNKCSKQTNTRPTCPTQQTEGREMTSESQQYSRDITCHYRPQIPNYTPYQPWNNFASNRPEYQPYYTQSGWRLPQNISHGYQNPHLGYQNSNYGYSMAQISYPGSGFTSQLPTARGIDSYTTASTPASNTAELSTKQVSSFPEIASYTTAKQDLSSNTSSQYGSPFQQSEYSSYPKFESAIPIVEKQRSSPVNNSTGSSPNHQSFDSTNSVSSLPKELIDFITTETLQNSAGQSSFSPISSTGSDDQNTSTVSFHDYTFPCLQNLSS